MSRIANEQGTLNSYTITGIELQKGDRFGYKICAIIWDKDVWCAYRAPTQADDDAVVKYGDMIPYDVAKYLFPTLANNIEHYGH